MEFEPHGRSSSLPKSNPKPDYDCDCNGNADSHSYSYRTYSNTK
jgi:hypothetical protein